MPAGSSSRDDQVQQCIDRCLGPRRVGGRYYKHQMGQPVTVLAIDRDPDGWMLWSITEATDDERAAGTSRTHCTGWDNGKDRMIAQPHEATAR
jgi:hypothetical protein